MSSDSTFQKLHGFLVENADGRLMFRMDALPGHEVGDVRVERMAQAADVAGKVGVPLSLKVSFNHEVDRSLFFIVHEIATNVEIALRAFESFQAGEQGSALDHWLAAEDELLHLH